MLSRERLSLLRQMARGMSAHFGPACEVVVHDLTGEDLEHTVVHIENGQVSGRRVGDGPSHAVLDLLRGGGEPPEDQLAYLTRTPDGKILKSSTLYIRGVGNQVEAIFSINFDISALMTVENALRPLTAPGAAGGAEPERITRSVADLLDDLIAESVLLVGKPATLMDREEKIRAIRFLNDAGALLITKSGDKIASYFGISKYTMYSYLDEHKG